MGLTFLFGFVSRLKNTHNISRFHFFLIYIPLSSFYPNRLRTCIYEYGHPHNAPIFIYIGDRTYRVRHAQQRNQLIWTRAITCVALWVRMN